MYSQWTTDLRVKRKTTKLLEENRKNPDDLGVGDAFLHPPPKARSVREKMDARNLMKIKNLFYETQISREREDKPQTGEIFAKATADSGLFSKTYKAVLILGNKKMETLI